MLHVKHNSETIITILTTTASERTATTKTTTAPSEHHQHAQAFLQKILSEKKLKRQKLLCEIVTDTHAACRTAKSYFSQHFQFFFLFFTF